MVLKDDYSLADGIAGNMDATNPARQEYESFVAANPELVTREAIVEGFFEAVQTDLISQNMVLNGMSEDE